MLADDGVTPYLFAACRYQPVWFREDAFAKHLVGPLEHAANENEHPLTALDCGRMSRGRLLGVTAWPGYDGVIVTHQGALEDAIAGSKISVVRPLSKGMALVADRSRPAAGLYVDLGQMAGRPFLRKGFSTDEMVDGRTASWSNGASSELAFDLTPVPSD